MSGFQITGRGKRIQFPFNLLEKKIHPRAFGREENTGIPTNPRSNYGPNAMKKIQLISLIIMGYRIMGGGGR
ncbi:hypothetical protein UR09_03420 [Candidatus Nitromaritima sp. SCGC AAA799-A02]|nr:hypothetical protein UZ36_06375 [Candidatus Nitromaritima sp. SCGC AAA799-C22]KMP11419.1 hypothetical protein UR09_03420 [Candidatus Nitromaritima sp. SCGC AAA799-A02]